VDEMAGGEKIDWHKFKSNRKGLYDIQPIFLGEYWKSVKDIESYFKMDGFLITSVLE